MPLRSVMSSRSNRCENLAATASKGRAGFVGATVRRHGASVSEPPINFELTFASIFIPTFDNMRKIFAHEVTCSDDVPSRHADNVVNGERRVEDHLALGARFDNVNVRSVTPFIACIDNQPEAFRDQTRQVNRILNSLGLSTAAWRRASDSRQTELYAGHPQPAFLAG